MNWRNLWQTKKERTALIFTNFFVLISVISGKKKNKMKLSIPENERVTILNELKKFNLKFQNIFPGDKPDRQPVHTVYGGAKLFKATLPILGILSLLNKFAPP